jgi:hypothetical protein
VAAYDGTDSRPSLRARWLASRMRQLRDDQGLARRFVTAHLDVDLSEFGRFERGEHAFTRERVNALLDVYRVHDPDERDLLLRLAQAVWQSGSELDFDGAVPDASFADLLWLESHATHIRCYSPLSIPDLLHTPSHAEQTARSAAGITAGQERIAAWQRLTADRQQRLDLHPERVELTVVMDACALSRPVGSPRDWQDQLDHIRQAATLPNVTIRVLPTDVPRPTAVDGAFSIFDLPSRYPAPQVVHIPYLGGRLFLEDSHAHATAFEHLYRVASDVDQPTIRIPSEQER